MVLAFENTHINLWRCHRLRILYTRRGLTDRFWQRKILAIERSQVGQYCNMDPLRSFNPEDFSLPKSIGQAVPSIISQ